MWKFIWSWRPVCLNNNGEWKMQRIILDNQSYWQPQPRNQTISETWHLVGFDAFQTWRNSIIFHRLPTSSINLHFFINLQKLLLDSVGVQKKLKLSAADVNWEHPKEPSNTSLVNKHLKNFCKKTCWHPNLLSKYLISLVFYKYPPWN